MYSRTGARHTPRQGYASLQSRHVALASTCALDRRAARQARVGIAAHGAHGPRSLALGAQLPTLTIGRAKDVPVLTGAIARFLAISLRALPQAVALLNALRAEGAKVTAQPGAA